MGTAIQTLFVGLNKSKVIITPKPTADVVIPYLSSKTTYCSLKTRYRTHQFHQRVRAKQVLATQAVSSDVKDAEVSSPQFDDFSVTTTSTDKDNEIKISVEVFGAKTEAIFNNVFSKMVAAAQPIPGFQRTKGGKFPRKLRSAGLCPSWLQLSLSVVLVCRQLPVDPIYIFCFLLLDAQPRDVPREILLEILGHTKVYKQVIKKVINSTIAEYVEKEGLAVSKDLRVEQSFEDLQAAFEPGDNFRFDAVVITSN
ncbi:hypothetical protein LguiA_002727 [Lonicera macranthoides]